MDLVANLFCHIANIQNMDLDANLFCYIANILNMDLITNLFCHIANTLNMDLNCLFRHIAVKVYRAAYSWVIFLSFSPY